MPDEFDDEDKSIVDALSALGWVEEKERDEEAPAPNLEEQLSLFKEQNAELVQEITKISEENKDLTASLELSAQKQEVLHQNINDYKAQVEALEINTPSAGDSPELEGLQTILAEKEEQIREKQEYIRNVYAKTNQQDQLLEDKIREINLLGSTNAKLMEEIKELKEQIIKLNSEKDDLGQKDEEIKELKEQIIKLNSEKDDLGQKDTEIKDLKELVEKLKAEQAESLNILEKLNEKDNKIKELNEQVQYLENDTVQKSKYEKAELLVEKKDEIITEKEKAIFQIQSELNSSTQKINDLEQQLETFPLVKKDITKKDERIKDLVLEVEDLKQKNIALESKGQEIQVLKKEIADLKKNLREAEIMEDKILDDLQMEKDKSLKLESQFEKKEKEVSDKDIELVELKKRIKVLRRSSLKP